MSRPNNVEHLSSVHNNPFVLEFGLDAVLRHEHKDAPQKSESGSETMSERDEQEEYHVNSGFVNKLKSKFAQLENKRNNTVSLSKRSASVEDLLRLDSHETSKRNHLIRSRPISSDDSDKPLRKADLKNFTATGYKPPSRPTSSELNSNSTNTGKSAISSKKDEKPPLPNTKGVEFSRQNFAVRSVKPPLPQKTPDVSKKVRKKSSSDSSKGKAEHHDWTVAPDVEGIGRDNIIIIESHASAAETQADKKTTSESIQDNLKQVRPMKGKLRDENELPKPNTVSAFRSLFEKTNKASETLRAWQHHSPTRRSSGSDTNSPASTPRSPLVKMNDDNVFDKTSYVRVEKDKNVARSPRNSWNKEESKSTRKSSSEFVPDIDTTPTSIKKSRAVFQKSSSNKESEGNSIPDNVDDTSVAVVETTLTPVHPILNVFDSKSVAKLDKKKKPKSSDLSHKKIVPKDTIELKHEHDKLMKSSPNVSNADQGTGEEIKIESVTDTFDGAISVHSKQRNDENAGDGAQNVFIFKEGIHEVSIQSTKKTSGKISPRKTKVFDSSNMVKRNREPPKISSPRSKPNEERNIQSDDISTEPTKDIAIKKEETNNEQTVVKPSDHKVKRVAPDPPIQISKSESAAKNQQNNTSNGVQTQSDDDSRNIKFKVKDLNFQRPVAADKQKKDFIASKSSNGDAPVSAMSSFLANRLKRNQTDQENQKVESVSTLVNGSASPVTQKRQAPEVPVINGSSVRITDESKDKTSAPPLPDTPEPSLPKSSFDNVIKRKKNTPQSSTKMIFDSSKIANKRKDPPKRKPPRKTVAELNKDITFDSVSVPKLDLSCITNDTQQTEYQEGYIPTIIKPCPFTFVGAEVVFDRSPYKKRKTKKTEIKTRFDDHATTTFEYEGEDVALESYLRDHPEELEEVRRQEQEEESGGVEKVQHWLNDVSDGKNLPNDSPSLEDGNTMKSNTLIGGDTGALTNYKSKMQTADFQFGVTPDPVEEYRSYNQDEPQPDPDSMQLVPASETELDAFSAEISTSDLMF